MGTSRPIPAGVIIKVLLGLMGVAAFLALAWNQRSFASCLDAGVIRDRLSQSGEWAPFAYMAAMALVGSVSQAFRVRGYRFVPTEGLDALAAQALSMTRPHGGRIRLSRLVRKDAP